MTNLFLEAINFLQQFPSLVVSFLNIFVCLFFIFVLNKQFNYFGLLAYIAISNILANIQILYATMYEILNIEVFLGTVIFCSSFLACDIINYRFGKAAAKKAVYLSIFIDIFFLLNIILTLGHKPLNYEIFQNFSISKQTSNLNIFALKQVFLPFPGLLLASYMTYLFSQLSEIWLFNKIHNIKIVQFVYIKHNIILFISSIILDTLLFTFLGLCLFAQEPLSLRDFFAIVYSAILIRFFCNLVNTLYMKIFVTGKAKMENVRYENS